MGNRFMSQQCQNMILSIGIFESACEMAAQKDDGVITKDEEKVLKRIQKAADQFKKELSKVK